MTIAIIDYGMGNLRSVQKALERLGFDAVVTRDSHAIDSSAGVVLPGVGAFGACMENLAAYSLIETVHRAVASGRPFLGICLGMQLMGESSEEGDAGGLGLVRGKVVKLKPVDASERLPHIGWNEVRARQHSKLFADARPETDFYFVHSYHMQCAEPIIASTTPFCGGFVSAIQDGALFGVQFHPEKSQKAGFALLKNFLAA